LSIFCSHGSGCIPKIHPKTSFGNVSQSLIRCRTLKYSLVKMYMDNEMCSISRAFDNMDIMEDER
jgi:hypothetical protein